WGFGGAPLLENITLRIEKGERVCLLGRNGAGKSSLFKILAGEILADAGVIRKQQELTIAALNQDVPTGPGGTVFEVVAEGLGEKGRGLVEHGRLCRMPETPEIAEKRDKLGHILDTGDGWTLLKRIESVLSRTRLDPEKSFDSLSAGMKRRTLFARALALEPDILLLDEPTNHLDIDAIIWMEEFILRHVKTLVFITHDRAFLKKIATRIIELERGSLASYACDYKTFLKRREAAFAAEKKENARFDKKISQEETWIRQGIKARRTRNEGRVKALIKMRETLSKRRKKVGNARLQVQDAKKTGKLVIEAKNLSFSYDNTPVIQNFSTVIMRGDKVGIIGPNGVGKTTLLKILLKDIAPQQGSVRHGENLEVAYFDQLRISLDENKSVRENIGEGNDFIVFNNHKRHVVSYLQDFLFSPERCRTPVNILSGGEKNRLVLAKLFTRPANVLVMDEPTNDLDAETLELLEELLFEFTGTLLLVSHDRAFLNNVVTGTIVFEEQGKVVEYAGGYDDWLVQRPVQEEAAPAPKKVRDKSKNKALEKNDRKEKSKKLGYKEKQELEQLPQKIDALELQQKDLYSVMSDPEFYKKDKEKIARIKANLEETQQKIETAYLRWEELEAKA
ncbi:ATP-binding cassette domain-containing protein, partial [Desulfobacterales bacterium HSG16]|nr:ATP-binding cassette domain-containing protein [Desulfobacterales bacterium HSG16]